MLAIMFADSFYNIIKLSTGEEQSKIRTLRGVTNGDPLRMVKKKLELESEFQEVSQKGNHKTKRGQPRGLNQTICP